MATGRLVTSLQQLALKCDICSTQCVSTVNHEIFGKFNRYLNFVLKSCTKSHSRQMASRCVRTRKSTSAGSKEGRPWRCCGNETILDGDFGEPSRRYSLRILWIVVYGMFRPSVAEKCLAAACKPCTTAYLAIFALSSPL